VLVCVCSSCSAHPAGVSAPPACGFYPSSSLTDAQWAIIEPLLPASGTAPGAAGGRRQEKHARRLVLDAIVYLLRGGIAARQLPVEFPPATGYDRFRAWAKAGVWQAVHDALGDQVRVYGGRDRSPVPRVSTPNRCARTPCPVPGLPDDTAPVSASTDPNVTSLGTRRPDVGRARPGARNESAGTASRCCSNDALDSRSRGPQHMARMPTGPNGRTVNSRVGHRIAPRTRPCSLPR
jgi:transposase